jgi:hypothetical protein
MKNIIPLFCAIIMCACSEQPPELWIAKEDVPAYRSKSDSFDKIYFVIKPGDACVKLQEYMDKDFLYTELLCKKGQGWIVDFDKFDVKIKEIRA